MRCAAPRVHPIQHSFVRLGHTAPVLRREPALGSLRGVGQLAAAALAFHIARRTWFWIRSRLSHSTDWMWGSLDMAGPERQATHRPGTLGLGQGSQLG